MGLILTQYFCSKYKNDIYEKSGLIEGKQDESVKSNNYFHYDEVTIEKLEFISDAKSVGFTIKEMKKQILQFKDDVLNDKC